jgi:hypothetical protein
MALALPGNSEDAKGPCRSCCCHGLGLRFEAWLDTIALYGPDASHSATVASPHGSLPMGKNYACPFRTGIVRDRFAGISARFSAKAPRRNDEPG